MASAEEYAAWIVQNRAKQGTPEFNTVAEAYRIARGGDRPTAPRKPPETPAFEREAAETAAVTPAELIAGSAPGRFALGAASPILGAVQLGANLLPGTAGRDVNAWLENLEGMKRRGMAAQPSPYPTGIEMIDNADVAGIAGNVASPVWAGAARMLPQAASVPARIAQGAAVGTTAGAATPVVSDDDYWTTKGGQALAGMVFGAALPASVAAAKGTAGMVKRTIEPMTEAGRAAILRRYQAELAGAKRPEIIQALENAMQLTPGSRPTAAEAVSHIPEASALAAHQKVISRAPETSGAFVARRAEQEGARRAAVGSVAQTPAALDAAVTARSAVADPLYAAARAPGNVADPRLALTKVDNILARNPGNRELVAELSNIRRGLVDDSGNVRTDAEQVASVLDGLKAAVADEKNKFIRGVLTAIKDDLVKAIPNYQQAQRAFAQASPPINQMQVGQYLQDKLTSATGAERTPAFAQAVRDAPGTIKKATGAPRFTRLDQVLNPKQEQAVQGVLSDLQRRTASEALARGTNLTGGAGIVEGARGPHLPNLLSRPAMVANFILKRIGEGADQKINRLAGEQYLDPMKLAAALRDVPAPLRQSVVQELVRMGRVPVMATTVQESVPQ